ncbi:MAG: hypothetical protein JOY87_04660 [Candidatus Eremiobacteraeota bacterium]|nr:hypothetical protein [Candidatus Eremiobacteraeota bacterium]MBV8263098.1 hypothetical protein [Candidatus Eremiobacteraeota bacterium]MBV8595560.1 hypothetical protein [Candidatus Eremiobacteraeota bacterium]
MHDPQRPPEPQRGSAPAEKGQGEESQEQLRAITREVDRITKMVERMNLGDYVGLLQRPGRLLWLNFLSGMARGLGTILGATVLVSLIVAVAQRIIASHLPGVGNFFAEFLELLRQQGKDH